MPPQDVVQKRLVDLSLFQQLLDPRQVFVSSYAGSDGDDVFRPKDFCGHAFVLNRLRVTYRVFGQSGA